MVGASEKASIVPDDDEGTLGHVNVSKFLRDFDFDDDYGTDREWAIRRKLEPTIIVAYAGVVAEKRYTGRRHDWVGARGELAWAADCILNLEGGGDPAGKYGDYLMARTGQYVEGWWPLIERVAAELMERDTLTGKEIREAMFGRLELSEKARQALKRGAGHGQA